MNNLFYKYRTLDNMDYFTDIIKNNRLYAPKYMNLNDRWEGHYTHDSDVARELTKAIQSIKKRLGIVSLTYNKNHTLMWSHYADGERGIIVGVRINDPKADIRKVIYEDKLPYMNTYEGYGKRKFARQVLSHKLLDWKYEEEVRVFVEDTSYLEVEVVEIIAGARMPEDQFLEIKSIVHKINPEISIIRNE